MSKKIQSLNVLNKRDLNKNHFVIELISPTKLPDIQAGQFVNVMVENSESTFLRRPLSIHFVDKIKNTISLFVKKVGTGTSKLGDLKVGDSLNIVFPLGNGFTLKENKNCLLIGGGCGVAPLMYLAKELKDKGNKVSVLLGIKSRFDIGDTSGYKNYGDLYITTENGTLGEKGYPTDHSILKEEEFDMIYTCGPEPMMKAVAKYANTKNIECEVSLENLMACGFGACLCCVTDTKEGHKCSCTEGPVFNTKDLKWEI
ncbi:MAG: dihydroorotate dehydrogenase electron transfer subunit [Marinifilaceae bacterium]|nr:dihydroorotate dehydrogenase electron transfer subunit [Marinifilaceae bacterium]